MAGDGPILLRVNDKDAGARIRRGYIPIGENLGVFSGVDPQSRKPEIGASCCASLRRMLANARSEDERIDSAK